MKRTVETLNLNRSGSKETVATTHTKNRRLASPDKKTLTDSFVAKTRWSLDFDSK